MRAAVLTIAFAAALVTAAEEEGLRPWKAPGPNDSRGPCPMLNTLANHGYLPHDGKNLTIDHMVEAVTTGLNADEMYGSKPTQLFLKEWGKQTFDLADLNTPGILQHIASLTRDDITPATLRSSPVVPARVEALLNDAGPDDGEFLTIDSMARSRRRVEALSKPAKLTWKELALAYVECSLVLMMMNEETVQSAYRIPKPEVWRARKDRVRVWLLEERLPDELGWKRSERTLQPEDLFPIVKSVFYEKAQLSPKALWQYYMPKFLGGKDRPKDEL